MNKIVAGTEFTVGYIYTLIFIGFIIFPSYFLGALVVICFTVYI